MLTSLCIANSSHLWIRARCCCFLNAAQDLISGAVLAHALSKSNNFGTWAQCLTAAMALTVQMALCIRRCGARGRSSGADMANCSVPYLWACSYDACVPPTASYGCEVWGLRALPAGDRRKARAALGSAHFRILSEIAAVPTSVHQATLLRELDQRPLAHAWWQRFVKL